MRALVAALAAVIMLAGCSTPKPEVESEPSSSTTVSTPVEVPTAVQAEPPPASEWTTAQQDYLRTLRGQAVLDRFTDDELLAIGREVLTAVGGGQDMLEVALEIAGKYQVDEFAAGMIAGSALGAGRL